MSQHSITFAPSGRGKAQCAPDPRYPNGVEIDAVMDSGQNRFALKSCAIDLPYPAPECGSWIVRCSYCDMSAAITAAGRPDDPRRVRLPCNPVPDLDKVGEVEVYSVPPGKVRIGGEPKPFED